MLFTVQLELLRFFRSTVVKFLHDANDNDICSTTSLAELISVREMLLFLMAASSHNDNVSDLIVHFALLYFFLRYLHI